MLSVMGAALCAVRVQDFLKMLACIHASVSVRGLHVSHGAAVPVCTCMHHSYKN